MQNSKTRAGKAAAKRERDTMNDRPLGSLTDHEARSTYMRQIANSPEDKRRYREWLGEEQWDMRIW